MAIESSLPFVHSLHAIRPPVCSCKELTASAERELGPSGAEEGAGALGVRRPASNALEAALASALNWRSSSIGLAGAEIGLWMCLAFGLEVAGVQVGVCQYVCEATAQPQAVWDGQ